MKSGVRRCRRTQTLVADWIYLDGDSFDRSGRMSTRWMVMMMETERLRWDGMRWKKRWEVEV